MRRVISIGLPLVLVIVVVAGAVYVIRIVQQTTAPVTELSQQLGTQVSQVLHPTPTIRPDPVTIVREVRSLARLETIQYTVEKVITAESGQGAFGFLFGDRLLLVAHGSVIAGIDLASIGVDDVWYDDVGILHLRLPAAEVLVARLDNEQTYVYDRSTGLLTRGNITLEAAARRAAEAEIRRGALEDGILDQAQINAENFLRSFLGSLGFDKVIFERPDAEPDHLSTPSPLPMMSPTPGS
jgi:hypothetical protein